MTKLQAGNGTRRETSAIIQGRALIVEMRPRTVVLRLKGRRYHYELGWESVWNRAAEIGARRQMDERRRKREEKRKARKMRC